MRRRSVLLSVTAFIFMNSELTNLLPTERLQALSRDHILRISVVAIVFVVVLTAASALLLLPTYVFLAKSSAAKEKYLASIESLFSSADEKALSARLTSLSDNAIILSKLGNAQSASAIIREALEVPRPGITISGLSYTPEVGESRSTLIISGKATTRDTLRNYQLALQDAPFADSVVLPVSSYAKDTDIPFTITVTLAP